MNDIRIEKRLIDVGSEESFAYRSTAYNGDSIAYDAVVVSIDFHEKGVEGIINHILRMFSDDGISFDPISSVIIRWKHVSRRFENPALLREWGKAIGLAQKSPPDDSSFNE